MLNVRIDVREMVYVTVQLNVNAHWFFRVRIVQYGHVPKVSLSAITLMKPTKRIFQSSAPAEDFVIQRLENVLALSGSPDRLARDYHAQITAIIEGDVYRRNR
jgi:hypothetical protein